MNFDRRTITVSAALFFGTLLVFSRAIGNDFVNYDDPVYVTENPQVQAGLLPGGIGWVDDQCGRELASAHLDFAHGGLVVV